MRFLNISQGTSVECHYYLILSRDINYLYDPEHFVNISQASEPLESYSSTILASTF